jgi:hypothetical protein
LNCSTTTGNSITHCIFFIGCVQFLKTCCHDVSCSSGWFSLIGCMRSHACWCGYIGLWPQFHPPRGYL